MKRIAILWLVIALITCLEREGQATTDPTLRLDSRADHVVKSPKGTSILVTFWRKLYFGGSGYCYRAVPVGCLKKPYELKECPRDIADLDWPESKRQKEDQDLWDWTSEINSADWTICHVQIAHRIPIVICDHLIQGGEPCLLFVTQIEPSCPYNLDEAVITNECYSLPLDT